MFKIEVIHILNFYLHTSPLPPKRGDRSEDSRHRGRNAEGIRGDVGEFCRAEAADHDPVLEWVTRLLLLLAGLKLGQSLNRVLLVTLQVFPKSVN